MLVGLTGWSTHSGKNQTKTGREFDIVIIGISGFLPGAGHDVHILLLTLCLCLLPYIYYFNIVFAHNVIYIITIIHVSLIIII